MVDSSKRSQMYCVNSQTYSLTAPLDYQQHEQARTRVDVEPDEFEFGQGCLPRREDRGIRLS